MAQRQAEKAEMSVHVFGMIGDAPVMEVQIGSKAGASAKVLTWGAVVRDLVVPTKSGPQRVMLGHRTIEEYVAGSAFFGSVPGRFANRIANGRFTLDGVAYEIARRPGEKHSLHGGPDGFARRIWKLAANDASSVRLELESGTATRGFRET